MLYHFSRLFLPHITDHYKDIITSKHVAIIKEYFANLGAITKEQEKYPLTFVHNDAHIGKNIAGRFYHRIDNVVPVNMETINTWTVFIGKLFLCGRKNTFNSKFLINFTFHQQSLFKEMFLQNTV